MNFRIRRRKVVHEWVFLRQLQLEMIVAYANYGTAKVIFLHETIVAPGNQMSPAGFGSISYYCSIFPAQSPFSSALFCISTMIKASLVMGYYKFCCFLCKSSRINNLSRKLCCDCDVNDIYPPTQPVLINLPAFTKRFRIPSYRT